MNLLNVVSEIEKTDPEIYERLDSRRNVFQKFQSLSGKIALAAVPIALGSIFQKAYGAPTPSTVLDIFNFALTLEYLESEFYQTGLAMGSALIPSSQDMADLKTIGDHEKEHVMFLTTAIKAAGGTPVAKLKFDFTAGSGSGNGPFKGLFENYEIFLAVAQTFEDTGVRAYKGQAPNLVKGGAYLTAALNIHSVEARHASHIRQMRKNNGFGDPKPWITGQHTNAIGAAVQPNYSGEENDFQGGFHITNINGFPISNDAATEAFDEPLSKNQVLALVKPFFA